MLYGFLRFNEPFDYTKLIFACLHWLVYTISVPWEENRHIRLCHDLVYQLCTQFIH